MRVLVSTRETQGARKNDFCFVPAGEILTFGFQCDNGHVDDHCGCSRSMVGLHCRKATTTMRLVDLPHITINKLAKMIEKSDHDAGFNSDINDITNWLIEFTDSLKDLPIGAIMERRGNHLMRRS